ncbi:glycosyltransferase family 1 protein [Corynebacterium sanguinis]|uniref:Glycosyltransferase family 1 protein n=1 Tax=Corynebacterium sanguinis TaxID=2594913 RepID=A0A6C1TWZ8_9CORY|nr:MULTISPECIES: glycosyltransferase family 4 protein [Corynebacterium]MBA4506082.1 glycosyltransferase family 1 protein [Corynebacterium sanguinis]MCT1414546.1 glycosyltransferase family 1 protein [Corynebacterium sanguinis]MCT1426321.1 glycosyltransferase family 1 protein [Corynebacterium sanguinis]MCT1499155.1 glycosyltransferase family 1 protein [Corynebacterium sanguinis]MCT1583929.1 glycosyltransferase family 1 protein [Corynebacterium sanguinis]
MKHLIVGPDGHGVTAYALQLAAALGVDERDIIRENTFDCAPLPDAPIHVTFTDHLFGTQPLAAVEALLGRVGERALSVSFHDIPQPEEGAERFSRRAEAYRRLRDAATVSVVNSQHEAQFFEHAPAVIRLPIPQVASHFDPVPNTVGILGFLYPGKGHEDLIAALAGTDYHLRFLGAVSQGHEQWARGLRTAYPHVEITGWLSADELAAEMGRVAVPVCAHRHFSASGSLMTWLGAGRNVLASDSPYTREIDAWLPGRITLVRDGAWREAVERFTPRVMDPPSYDWGDVALVWERQWAACGLT